MKRSNTSLYVTIGCVVLFAGLIYLVVQLQKPAPIAIEIKPTSGSTEQARKTRFIGRALTDPEAATNATIETATVDVQTPLPAEAVPTKEEGWRSEPAPNLDIDELSPQLQHLLRSEASLRTEAFVEAASSVNQTTVQNLRTIRKERLAKRELDSAAESVTP